MTKVQCDITTSSTTEMRCHPFRRQCNRGGSGGEAGEPWSANQNSEMPTILIDYRNSEIPVEILIADRNSEVPVDNFYRSLQFWVFVGQVLQSTLYTVKRPMLGGDSGKVFLHVAVVCHCAIAGMYLPSSGSLGCRRTEWPGSRCLFA